MSIVLDGKLVATQIEADLFKRVEIIKAKLGFVPVLATILVGDDPASATYVKMKANACKRVGLESLRVELPEATSTTELEVKIKELNSNPQIMGILLQHPVPSQIDERVCFDAININKDVDGVTCLGFGLMSMGQSAYGSATPAGIMALLKAYNLNLNGLHAVVVGRSPILGKPMSMMLLNANATVTICHSHTQGLQELIGTADLVVGAVGKKEFIKADWIKDQAIVVDAGYHPPGVGDIELMPLIGRCKAYTPVPGGVGPMTIVTLIRQTVEAAEKQALFSERI